MHVVGESGNTAWILRDLWILGHKYPINFTPPPPKHFTALLSTLIQTFIWLQTKTREPWMLAHGAAIQLQKFPYRSETEKDLFFSKAHREMSTDLWDLGLVTNVLMHHFFIYS